MRLNCIDQKETLNSTGFMLLENKRSVGIRPNRILKMFFSKFMEFSFTLQQIAADEK